MLEEMDRKSCGRSVQSSSKGNGTEPKKQDVPTSSKQQPRWRKREPLNSSGSKYEQGKKPFPQKTKSLDKRPRPRGYYCGSRKEEAQIKDELEAELGLAPGDGKKRSLNHLLNFHYERRGCEVIAPVAPRPYYVQPHTTKALMATRAHKYNKEHFLQANCQFVVRSSGDYGPYLGDPDLLVDWDHIELIRVTGNEVINCPICLYPPVAGKITRCGHVFCWACILHYLSLSDKNWRKCPICYEAVHKNNLKSVGFKELPSYKIGETITFKLMRREKGTLISTPVEQFDKRMTKTFLSISELELDTSYSKILLANQSEVQMIIDKERGELLNQAKESTGSPEVVFVEHALELLAEREILLEGRFSVTVPEDTTTSPMQEAVLEDSSASIEHQADLSDAKEDTGSKNEGASEDQSSRTRFSSISSEGDHQVNVQDLFINSNQQSTKSFYFYQAVGGGQVYLHALNVHMLEMAYGSLAECPPTLSGAIVELEMGSMTPELRQRLRYLQHLPVTCQFDVVEIALHPPLIPTSVFHHFHDQLENRKRARARRARQEKRRSRQIDDLERQMLGRSRAPDLRIQSHFHFPECGTLFDPPLSSTAPSPPRSQGSSRDNSPPPPPQDDHSALESTFTALSIDPAENMSFAQMLREGGGGLPRGGWPAVGGGSTSGASRRRQPSVSAMPDSDPELAEFSPPARPTFTIADAINLASINNTQAGRNEESRGGKKKKKKKQVLFTTGMMCGGNN